MNSNGWVFRLGLVMPLVMAFLLIINSLLSSGESIRVQGKQIEVFEDASSLMDIDAISKLDDSNFETLNGNAVPNFGFSRSNIWIRFTLDGNQFNEDNFILEVKNPVLDRIDLYEFHSTEYKLINETGDLLEHDSRQINHRNFRFDIRLSDQEQKVYYLMVNSGGEQLYVPLILHSKTDVAVTDLKDQLIIGSYFGIILFVILFNLFLYLIIQERSHIYYVLYNFNLLLLQVSLTGFGFQFLWPNSPYLANVTNPFFASVAVFSLLKFSQYFLQLKKFFPKINKVFQVTGVIILVNAIISLFNVQPLLYFAIIAVNVLTLLLNVAIIPVAVGVVRKGFGPAKFFLAAFIILVLTVFGFILTNLGIIQSDFFATNGLLIGSAMEVVLLSFAIVDKFRNYKDDALNNLKALNKLQIEQNVVLEKKVEERTREIFEQQQEILSSIRYAERIQRNILPNEAAMQSLFPKSFVYYLPKDIISGDFYWINENRDSTNEQNILRFATGDCTGHGVPGAMMSILGYNLIREALEHFPKGSSAQLLEEMDRLLKNALNSGAYSYASDGMDIVICQIDLDKNILNMGGANLGALVYRDGELLELKGTRRPLGLIDEKLRKPFEDIHFDLQRGDIIYTFTDGYVDQFGGEDQKKLKQKGLKELLLRIATFPLHEQKEELNAFHLRWRGELEQVDDICIMAIQYGV